MSTSTAQPLRTRMPRLAGAAVERARLTVVPRRRVQAPRVPFVTLVSLVLLAGVVGLLLFNTQMQQASFTATTLQERADDLSAREETLADELRQRRSPNALAEAAQARGMVPPVSSNTLYLATGEVVGEAAPATAEGKLPLNPPPPARPAILDPAPIVVVAPPAAPPAAPPVTEQAPATP